MSNDIPEDLRTVTGSGISARWRGHPLRLGSLAFTAQLHALPLPAEVAMWQLAGDVAIGMSDDDGWLAFFRIADPVRADVKATLDELRNAGISVGVLSGDADETTRRIARELDIDAAHGGLSPEAKRDLLKALQSEGNIVAMVGDGVNDAPVLAQAQLSVAMGSGTELARTQADIVLTGSALAPIAEGVAIARRTLAIVRQNLIWAFVYNLTAIPLAMAGGVTPWMAGIGMSLSSLLVILNSLRLQRA